ncbi:CK1/CK1/CK1-D protein kinase [Suillus fuscotomentosus]|uniref:CK1/CK1/CK1-D protein kinase n=1 Tax=Suillus fuscotomentosus TaxID=1912939 RepID=A0AAD4DUD4_9AGAM|nr:CK1/CK1/CK1-D protein kinase [Suillus fuscotomentosus]KAG1893028.1 CK1/CK1/CK1-D protein kinase [Suillus fuscotomentosus]
MSKAPLHIDGRFGLENILGSGSYAIVYCTQNFLNDDIIAIKLEPVTNNPPSLKHKHCTLKQLEGGVGIPHVLWFGRELTHYALALDLLGRPLHDLFLTCNQKFRLQTVVNLGDQLLSHLGYIHSHGYVHGNVKPENAMIDILEKTVYIIDFGITKRYWNSSTASHIPFHRGRHLTGTPAFASINNHLGLEPGHRGSLESLAYILIYFLHGSLPWLNSDHEKLSGSFILECKVGTAIADLCEGITPAFANILVYSHTLSFSEDPDYDYLHYLLHDLRTAGPAPAMHSLDFDYLIPPSQNPELSESVPTCLLKATPLHRSTHV